MIFSEISLLIESVSKFLDDFGPILLTKNKLNHYHVRINNLREKSARDPACLFIGLIGGTGVGKSTLINAIANRKISDASDRRPFTDKVVAYRHIENPHEFNEVSHLFKNPDAVHDHDELKAITICDLPDTDSHNLSNREAVTQILPYLDAIIWVTSPEKYADSSFFEHVKDSYIHKDNFIFVINKMDQLVDSDSQDPLSRVKEIAGDLAFRLNDNARIVDASIYCVSSLLEFQSGDVAYEEFLSNEFARFRECLSLKWNNKQIKAAKQSNLVKEIEDVLFDLYNDIDPEHKKKALETVEMTRKIETESFFSPKDFFHLRELLETRFTRILADKDSSVRSVNLVLNRIFLRNSNTLSKDIGDLEAVLLVEAARSGRERLLEAEKKQSDIISTVTLSTGVKNPTRPESLLDIISKDCAAVAFERSKTLVEKNIDSSSKFVSRLGRHCQSLILFLPFLVMALKLSGLSSFSEIVDNNSWFNLLDHVLRLLTSFFSSEGLVAVTVLCILEIALIIFMALRRLKKIEKLAKAISSSVTAVLSECLNSSVKREIDKSLFLVRKMEEGIEAFSILNSKINKISVP